ncbi:MAG: response regulator [Myxococcota bacterium]
MTARPISAKPRVLVVEDEPSVRRITRYILEHGGYDVVEATDGAEAIDLLNALNADIELVLADVHMPRVDGVTLMSHVTAEWPDLPVLLMSARADDARYALQLLELDVQVVEKPFRLASLLELVGSALVAGRGDSERSAAA